jgi:hypothetical protein
MITVRRRAGIAVCRRALRKAGNQHVQLEVIDRMGDFCELVSQDDQFDRVADLTIKWFDQTLQSWAKVPAAVSPYSTATTTRSHRALTQLSSLIAIWDARATAHLRSALHRLC